MLTKTLEHILASGLFSAFFEVIIHDIPHENAAEYLEELKAFYTAGWKKLWEFNALILFELYVRLTNYKTT